MPSDPLQGLRSIWPLPGSFSATVSFRFINRNLQTHSISEMECAFLDGSSCLIVKSQGADAGLEAFPSEVILERVGLVPEWRLIADIDTQVRYWVFSPAKMVWETDWPESQIKAEKAAPQKRKFLGKESVNGHRCQKWAVEWTTARNKQSDAIVWEADDLKGFPVRIRFQNMVMDFKNISLDRPSRVRFIPPAEFQRFGTWEDLLAAAVQENRSNNGSFTSNAPQN